jgi:2-keto-4-pentenoate hydratase/2-oxohepta-3-ene-1,7-dioic acid hydratase in catechol pathway
MKFARIIRDGRICLCLAEGDTLVDLSTAEGLPHTLADAFAYDGLSALLAARDLSGLPRFSAQSAVYAPAVPEGGKIIMTGINYREHIAELGETFPGAPVLFGKFSNALAAHGQAIEIPSCTRKMDYEAELVAVIGKRGKHVPAGSALSHVFGYTCGNDFSARDLQFASSQWLCGKTSDGFAPVGPHIVTADSLDPSALDIVMKVNGRERQHSNTRMIIFSLPEIISYASDIMTLEPGDILFTGTPSGVIQGYPKEKQSWLQPGDITEVIIEGIGTLANTLIREA